MSVMAMAQMAFDRKWQKDQSADASARKTETQKQPASYQIQTIAAFIPTEVLGLYTSLATAMQATEDKSKANVAMHTAWIAFYIFLLITPLAVWLIYAGKVKAKHELIPLEWKRWPMWEMIAATVAYIAWAYSMPNSPFSSLKGYYNPGFAALVLPTCIMFLGLLEPLLAAPDKEELPQVVQQQPVHAIE